MKKKRFSVEQITAVLQQAEGGVPVGEARVMIDNLTRSGLVLSSRPIDLALVARLSPTLLQTRAVLQEEGNTRGRLQARIANLWLSIEQARLALYNAARLGDLGSPEALMAILGCKILAAEASVSASNEAMTLCGGIVWPWPCRARNTASRPAIIWA